MSTQSAKFILIINYPYLDLFALLLRELIIDLLSPRPLIKDPGIQ